MKRRVTPFIIGITIILISSLAYAADRRKQNKHGGQPIDPIHEEEALRAELLEAVADNEKKASATDNTGKIVLSRTDKINHSKSSK